MFDKTPSFGCLPILVSHLLFSTGGYWGDHQHKRLVLESLIQDLLLKEPKWRHAFNEVLAIRYLHESLVLADTFLPKCGFSVILSPRSDPSDPNTCIPQTSYALFDPLGLTHSVICACTIYHFSSGMISPIYSTALQWADCLPQAIAGW